MIINNINGYQMLWTQTGKDPSQIKSGRLSAGEYTVPFEPVGGPPYKVELKVSNGFTTEVESPETLVSFLNQGSNTKPLNSPKVVPVG